MAWDADDQTSGRSPIEHISDTVDLDDEDKLSAASSCHLIKVRNNLTYI